MKGYQLSKLGLFTPLGNSVESLLSNVLSPKAETLTSDLELNPQRPVQVAKADELTVPLPDALASWDCRNNRMLAKACQQIEPDITELKGCYGADRVAVIIGTSTSGIADFEMHQGSPESFNYRKQEIGTAALFVQAYFQLTGFAYTISTACTSSAKALASAARMLDSGLADAVICGGCDSLCQLTVTGFDALDSYASGATAPMTFERDGINIGEAAVLFVMTKESGGIRLTGIGESSDAHHISAPHPNGDGAVDAIERALASANIQASDLDYINLHGTGTPLNDSMETLAVSRCGAQYVPASTTKTLTGHTLGAAGALEAAICWSLLSDINQQRQLPSQIFRGDRDPKLTEITFANTHHRLPKSGGKVLSNSFAFGGNNASLIVEKAE